MCIYINISKS